MELLDKRIQRSLPYLRLYLDHFLELESLLKEHGEEPTEIKTDTYALSSLSELAKLPSKRVSLLEIKTPSLKIVIRKDAAFVIANNNSALLQGIIGQVETVLLKGKRPIPSAFLSKNYGGLGYLMAATCFVAFIMFGEFMPRLIAQSVLVVMGLSLTYGILSGMVSIAVLIPGTKASSPPFIERNRDQLWMGLVFTIVGIVLTLVVQWLMRSFGMNA